MPPKIKVSRENIIKAALEIVRNSGEEALNARNIAAVLGCSTQPIFSNFVMMDELKCEVAKEAKEIYFRFVKDIICENEFSGYKAECMAYITFAKIEKHLFKLLFLNGNNLFYNKSEQIVFENTGLSGDTAELFNLEMQAFVQGMAVMTANASFPLHEALISQMFDDAYEGLRTRFNV